MYILRNVLIIDEFSRFWMFQFYKEYQFRWMYFQSKLGKRFGYKLISWGLHKMAAIVQMAFQMHFVVYVLNGQIDNRSAFV